MEFGEAQLADRILALLIATHPLNHSLSMENLLNLVNSSLWKLTAEHLLREVESAKPTPGGGSVSVITAAFGLALLHMGVSVSLKRSTYGTPKHQRLFDLRIGLSSLTNMLSSLADDDSRAFESYMKARSSPRSTDREIATRDLAMQDALLQSSQLPLDSAVKMIQGLKLAESVMELAEKHVFSDIYCGAILLGASVKGVLLNVDANLSGIKNAEQKKSLKAQRVELECEAALLLEVISNKIPQDPMSS